MDNMNDLERRSIMEMQRAYRRLPYGTRRLAATLDALAAADQLDSDCRITVRYDLAYAYGLGDDPAKALPVCAEFFALLEQYPDTDGRKIIAIAMIALYVATSLPQIPLVQCQALLDQFRQQVKKYGIGERLWQIHACNYCLMIGDVTQAQTHLKAFYATARDATSDCAACEASNAAECLLKLDLRKEARAALQPVLDGSLTCEQQPWSALAVLIHDALDHGELENAKELGQRLCKKALRNCGDLACAGALLRLWADTDEERAIGLLEKGIHWSIGMWDQSLLFDFYRGGWAVCTNLGEDQKKIPMHLPKKFPCWREDGVYDSTDLAAWFYAQMTEIAGRFDSRNGNDDYAKKRMPSGGH